MGKQFLRFLLAIIVVYIAFALFSKKMVDAGLHPKARIKIIPAYAGLQQDTALMIGKTRVDIRVPRQTVIGDVLFLPGWSFSTRLWCDSTSLCAQALAAGYRVIMPDMNRSVYATKYYPETRYDMAVQPTCTWLTDTCFKLIEERYGVFKQGANYILGISTGGRGVAMVCAHTGTLFKAGAALSGDFDQTIEPTDQLMILTYGPYEAFKDRWAHIDNPYTLLDKLQVPLYIAYGSADPVVPVQQSLHYFNALKKVQPASKMKVMRGYGHNFKFWKPAADSAWAYLIKR